MVRLGRQLENTVSEITENETIGAGKASIGTAAARKREQLQRMTEAELRRKQAAREERAQLTKELAELEAREGRHRRELERKERQRASFVLGEIVIDAMRHQGLNDFKVTIADFAHLKLEDFEKVKRVVSRGKTPTTATVNDDNNETSNSANKPDIEL